MSTGPLQPHALRVFLSSILADPLLVDLRNSLVEWGAAQGIDVWAFENRRSKSAWDRESAASAERICLNEVRVTDLFIGIYRAAYGSSAASHQAALGLTDLEFFEAFRRGRVIRFYVIEAHDPLDPRLEDLLRVIHQLSPQAFGGRGSTSAIGEIIKSDILAHFNRHPFGAPISRSSALFQRYVASAWQERHALDLTPGRFNLLSLGTTAVRPSPMFIRSRLSAAVELQRHDDRLPVLLSAAHSLLGAPYEECEDAELLGLWDSSLAALEQSSAWMGLHGMPWNGRLAILNSLLAVRAILAGAREVASLENPQHLITRKAGAREEWLNLLATAGSVGSEYYSTAKISPPRRQLAYLNRAMNWLLVAQRRHEIQPDPQWMAGIASIRGHVRIARQDPIESIRTDFELSYRLRREGGADDRSIYEAMVDLGHLCTIAGQWRRAEQLLVEGVAGLERTKGEGFAARAKMQLAEFHRRRGHLFAMVRQIREADAICQLHGMADREALAGTFAAFTLRHLRRLWPRYSRLVAEAHADGYRFIEV
ncbi:hypothetical protein PHYC_03252 [Phycisphaerales bacterium]|nr:hypothetical protein PHYC_03252 [Phycisphaerales bacterium]